MNIAIKTAMTIAIFMVASVVNAAGLVPMPQYYDSEMQAGLDGVFLITEPQFDAYITGEGAASIVTPGGEVITESNASGYGFSWVNESGSDGESLTTVSTSNAEPGEYAFSVTPSGENTASFSVVEEPSIQFGLVTGVEGQPLEAGKPFSLVGIAYFNHEPATGGSLEITIKDMSGQTVTRLSPLDDGGSIDPVANDGAYSGVTMLSQAGSYRAIIEFSWQGKKGRIIRPVEVKNISANFSLSGDFDVEALDGNENDLTDAYRLTFEETPDSVREQGDYAFTVEVSDSSQPQEFITATRVISDPSELVWIDVPVEKLQRLGGKPWQISKVYAWKDDSVVGIWNDFGELIVDVADFERPPITLSIADDRGLDEDDDGLFENLEIDVDIDALYAGSYGMSGDLRNTDGKVAASIGISQMSLSTGSNIVTLDFSGMDIGSAGGDGPFELTNVLIYPNFSSDEDIARLIPKVGTTGAYLCADFIGCGSDLAQDIKRVASNLCKKHQRNVLKQLRRIEAMSKRNPQAGEAQLRALYHRAVTLEKSGSCPPAHGLFGDRE